MFILLLVFSVFAAPAQSCVTPCIDGVCSQGSRASLVSDGDCVFDATVYSKDVFVTGHIFSMGTCAAVQKQVSRNCYKNMASAVAEGLQGMPVANETVQCITHIHNTPCALGEHKWYINSTTKVGTCADLKLLYEDAMEECLREKEDARFWYSILYVIGLFVGIVLVAAICQLIGMLIG